MDGHGHGTSRDDRRGQAGFAEAAVWMAGGRSLLADRLHDVRVGDLGTCRAGDVEDTIGRAERNDSPDAMISSVT